MPLVKKNYEINSLMKNARNGLQKTLIRCFLTSVMLMALTGSATAQNYSTDVNWLIEVLQLKNGSSVADIGAGDGDQTLAIARYVGPDGQVYSTELGSESLQELRSKIDEVSADNVTVVEGHPKQTNLPDECCDALFLRRVYHHFNDPVSMNKSLWRSLKPGGRLAIIDFEPRGSEAEPSGRASGSQHGVTAKTVIEELRQAGFKLISSEQRSGRDVYVVMEKLENTGE